ELSEDCWLVYAEDFGDRTEEIRFSALESLDPDAELPRASLEVPLTEWRNVWKRRLRPLLMPKQARALYEHVAARSDTKRFGDLAAIGIGYVSGGNDFFHLRPSKVAELGLPDSLLQPTVRNSRYLGEGCVSVELVERWRRADEPILLLNIPKQLTEIPKSVRRYLDS